MSDYKVGSIIKGQVTGIEKYGIFINIDPWYDGLIHISEISQGFVKDINDYVKIGDTIYCQILEVDEDNLQLKLSIKKSVSSSTGEVIDDTKKSCTDDFIEVTPDSVLEFNYNGLWGVARGFTEDKNFVATINVYNDPSPTDIRTQGKYTIPANVKYIKLVLALNGDDDSITNSLFSVYKVTVFFILSK